MMIDRSDYELIEANDRNPDHALEIARAWRPAVTDLDWNCAEASRYGGLILYCKAHKTALHFTNTSSGERSSDGPHATVAILHEFDFGDLQTLKDKVLRLNHCEFERPRLRPM